MATLTHNLDTIEQGSVNWRLILNSNLEKLDNNRIFTISSNNLPSNSGKYGRFFYTTDTNNLYFDDGINIIQLTYSSFKDLVGIADMTGKAGYFAIVNNSEDGLEFTDTIDLGTF